MIRQGFMILGLVAIVLAQQPGSPEDKTCMDAAFGQYVQSINALITDSSPADRGLLRQFIQDSLHPRYFYRAIWEDTPISGDQWRTFCRASLEGARAFDNCPDSLTKSIYLAQVGYTGYVCQRLVEDIANNTDCLRKASLQAKAACADRCSEYENGSKTFVNPSLAATGGETDMTPYLILDCEYLNCTATCAQPIFQDECPSVGDLQLHTLHAMEAWMRQMNEPFEFRGQIEQARAAGREVGETFPAKCNALAAKAEGNS